MSLVRKLAGETAIYGIGQILPRILQYIVFSTYLTYRLNESRIDYAIYLDLYAYVSVLLIIFSYRMDTSIFRFGKKEEDLPKAYSTALIPMIGTSCLVVLIGHIWDESLAAWLSYPGKGYYIRWFSIIVALDVLCLMPFARLRLLGKARSFVSFKIGNVLLTIFLVLAFLELLPWIGIDARSLYPGFLSSDIDFVFMANLIASAVLFIRLLLNNLPQRWEVDWDLWKRMVVYALPLIVVGVAGNINQFFGVPLQKFFLGNELDLNKDQAAVYGAIQKIPALLAMFITAYTYAAEPFFFKNSEEKDARVMYGRIALYFIWIGGILALPLYLFIDAFQFLIGPNFRDGLYYIPILLMAYLFLGIYYNVSIWYKLSDKTIYGAYISIVGAVITVGGSILLLPEMGVIASAWVALLCYLVMALLAFVIGQQHYRIEYPLKEMLGYTFLIALILLLDHNLRTESVGINLIMGLGFLLLYVFVIYYFNKSGVKRLIRSIK